LEFHLTVITMLSSKSPQDLSSDPEVSIEMAPLAAAAFTEFAPPPRPPTRFALASSRPARASTHLRVVERSAAEPAAEAAPSPHCETRAAALYREMGPLVYRRCLRLLRDPEAARDATQEVFLRLVRGEVALEEREDLAPWLFRVATNYCLNLRRNARHRGETSMDDGVELAEPVRGDRLDAIVVQRLLARFDTTTQLIATAILVDEQEHEDVAAALGLSRRTMARKLERFIELARRHLVVTGDASASQHH
jgi:RNA polymerase sigma-70 factor (ECF subfamily)